MKYRHTAQAELTNNLYLLGGGTELYISEIVTSNTCYYLSYN